VPRGLADIEATFPRQWAVPQEFGARGSYVFIYADFARATRLLALLIDGLALQRPFSKVR
jgi:hypothetical protein